MVDHHITRGLGDYLDLAERMQQNYGEIIYTVLCHLCSASLFMSVKKLSRLNAAPNGAMRFAHKTTVMS
jgi:hypothetical protein